MRKFIKYKVIGLAFLVFAIVSCDTASQDVSPVISPDDYPVATFTLDNSSSTFTEGDTIIYTVSLDKPIERAITFSVLVDESSTMEAADYTVVNAKIVPWAKSAKLMIISTFDGDIETAETIKFKFVINSIAEKNLVNPTTVFPEATYTVNNYVGEDLLLEFGWETDIDLGFGIYPTSSNVDFDIYYAPSAGFDITDCWANAVADYTGATGSHPETFEISGWADGEYVFFFDLWANAFAGYGNTTEIPVYVDVAKYGAIQETIVQDPTRIINAETPGYDDDGTASNGVVVILTVSGTIYTVKDYSGATVATGKSVTFKTQRPNMIWKK